MYIQLKDPGLVDAVLEKIFRRDPPLMDWTVIHMSEYIKDKMAGGNAVIIETIYSYDTDRGRIVVDVRVIDPTDVPTDQDFLNDKEYDNPQ